MKAEWLWQFNFLAKIEESKPMEIKFAIKIDKIKWIRK